MGKYNRYDDEFKQNLVNLYPLGYTLMVFFISVLY